jgi:hypothetical protein
VERLLKGRNAGDGGLTLDALAQAGFL